MARSVYQNNIIKIENVNKKIKRRKQSMTYVRTYPAILPSNNGGQFTKGMDWLFFVPAVADSCDDDNGIVVDNDDRRHCCCCCDRVRECECACVSATDATGTAGATRKADADPTMVATIRAVAAVAVAVIFILLELNCRNVKFDINERRKLDMFLSAQCIIIIVAIIQISIQV